MGTGNSHLMNIGEKKNDIYHFLPLTKLTMVLAYDSKFGPGVTGLSYPPAYLGKLGLFVLVGDRYPLYVCKLVTN